MLTILIALSMAIWPFTEQRNHTRNWYARRINHARAQHITNRQHKHSWFTNHR